LKAAGWQLVVVTNQPDVATGKLDRAVLDAMHERLMRELPLDAIQVCCHVDADACACRKPKPGLLLDAARERDLALPESFMVGDRWRDVSAGRAAGCRSFFIDYGYAEALRDQPDFTVRSLPEAVELILRA
jgi:D-glycero-D-manno-heptose 1,7-bisphosphate phosphatase